MTCRKNEGGCGGEWCWMCAGDWKTHGERTGGFFSCNKYQESERFKIDQENEQIKADVERFQHHFARFFEHGQAEKDVLAATEKILDKSLDYREKRKLNPDFLTEAQDLLAKVRHALKYTYIYGFYLPKDAAFRALFEMQQTKLEAVCETLSTMALDTAVETIDHTAVKNQIRVVRTFMTNLVEAFEEEAKKAAPKASKKK